jgi:hypothetical protein
MRVAPLDDPLGYPGEVPDGPFLLDGDDVEVLDPGLTLDAARDLASATQAVVAVGSNASPAQLARKFGGQPCRGIVVGLRVRVPNLQVLPSGHLSRTGYWPFAPARAVRPAASEPLDLVLCLLDDEQLSVLDATEPNYRRVPLSPDAHPVRVAGGGAPATCWVYDSRHGVVDDPRLPRWTPGPPSQEQLLRVLLAEIPELGVRSPASLIEAVRADPGVAAGAGALLRRRLRTRPSGLGQVWPDPSGAGTSAPSLSNNDR